MVTITVTGAAQRHLTAEVGTVTIAVESTGEQRETVLAQVSVAHTRLLADAERYVQSGAALWWRSPGVVTGAVWEWLPDKPDTRVRRFRASTTVAVRFSDVAALSGWLLDIGVAPELEIRGIDWDLTDQTRDQTLAELRTTAVRDAVARAAGYAAAAGLGTPELTTLFEEGLRPGSADPGMPRPMKARAMMADAGGAALEVQPPDLVLEVEISADFEAGR